MLMIDFRGYLYILSRLTNFPDFSITAASTIDDSELSELLRQDANQNKQNAANAKVDP